MIQDRASSPRFVYLIGLMMAAVYLFLGLNFSQYLHFSRAFDEGYHLEYITFIKQHGRLPVTYQERAQITRADFPPLYQLLISQFSTNVSLEDSPKFKLYGDSFRYRAIDHQREEVWTLDTEDLQPPYLGQFLIWQIGRKVSVVLSLATLVVVFFTLRDIPPLGQRPWLALAGAALLAFIPRYAVLGATLNDDNLLGLLAALYFWMLVKIIKRPQRWWPVIGLGIFLGLSITVKYTLVVAPLEILLIFGLMAGRGVVGWSWFWQRIGVIGGAAVLFSGWWFGWNIWFLNTVAEDGWIAGLSRPLFAGGTDTTLNRISGLLSGGQVGLTALPEDTQIGTFSEWAESTFLSFWGFGAAGEPLYPYIYFAIGLMLAGALFGLWRLWRTDITSRQWIFLFALHIGLFLLLPLIRFELTRRLSVAAQGRHILIPAAAAIAALLVWGLATALSRRPAGRLPVFGVIIAGLMGWTGLHLFRTVTDIPPPPLPMRTTPQAAEWLRLPVQATFANAIELVSYEFESRPESGLLEIQLAWRSLAHVNENYLVKVMLTDSAGSVVSHWLGYNGQGRLPTLAWDPGDSVFDRLVLPLPNLPSGDYTLQVQLIGSAGPLPITHQPDNGPQVEGAQDTSLLLTTISLVEPSTLNLEQEMKLVDDPSGGPLPVNYCLWQTGGVAEQSSPPLYRYPATITVLTSRHDLTVELIDAEGQIWPAAESEAGVHSFIIGPRRQSGTYRLRISSQSGGQLFSQSGSEPLLVVENWWERQFEPPEIVVPAQANFADQINFLGYDLPQTRVKAGEAFPVTLYWQAPAHKSPQADFTQFNHLHDSNGALYGGYDRRPLENYSTLLWSPGEIVADGYTVPVDANAPPGEYYLDAGFYLTVGEAAVNLPLVVDGQMSQVSSVTIGPIEVVAP